MTAADEAISLGSVVTKWRLLRDVQRLYLNFIAYRTSFAMTELSQYHAQASSNPVRREYWGL